MSRNGKPIGTRKRNHRAPYVGGFFAHSTAEVSPEARIGEDTKIWQFAQVREGAKIGRQCILGKDVYVDSHVFIGDNVKVQNGVSIYHGVTIEDGVFCGPHCVFTNDKLPRAVNPDGSLKGTDDWAVFFTWVKMGASIGAHATIVCGTIIGRWAMVGAGSVVTRDIPDYGLVYGNPARLHGFVCACGSLLTRDMATREIPGQVRMRCTKCEANIAIPARDYALLREYDGKESSPPLTDQFPARAA